MQNPLQSDYEKAGFLRSGWTRKACQLEAGRLQLVQDRLEHRARLANNRVRGILRASDLLRVQGAKPADGAGQINLDVAPVAPVIFVDSSLKAQILSAKVARDEAEGVYRRLLASCTHRYARVHESAVCEICAVNGGWWCTDSPDHLCAYTGQGEFCVHCGNPDERQ